MEMNPNTIGLIKQRLEILYQLVEALESGGGSGGDSYTKAETNALLDEKVDKVAGSSLMTTAQSEKLANIAAGAEVNVQADWSQSDDTADDYIKNKPTIPDVSNYYTKTETGNEIDAAIAALDVSSTTATGHYIKSIAQEDGKIAAVAELIDTTPTVGSTKPITSGGVQSAIANFITATNYATQNTGGTVKAWTTTSGDVTTLHIATE